jgi:hypothetical protein
LGPDTAPMDPSEYRVVIVRAWREADSVRIRMLAGGDPGRQWVLSSIADAGDVLVALLTELVPPAQSARSHTND